MSTASRDWDAASYDRVSDPQFRWAQEQLERLRLGGGGGAVCRVFRRMETPMELRPRRGDGGATEARQLRACPLLARAKERHARRSEGLRPDRVPGSTSRPASRTAARRLRRPRPY